MGKLEVIRDPQFIMIAQGVSMFNSWVRIGYKVVNCVIGGDDEGLKTCMYIIAVSNLSTYSTILVFVDGQQGVSKSWEIYEILELSFLRAVLCEFGTTYVKYNSSISKRGKYS